MLSSEELIYLLMNLKVNVFSKFNNTWFLVSLSSISKGLKFFGYRIPLNSSPKAMW